MNAEAQIRAVFEADWLDGAHHPNAPVIVVKTRGRCVHLTLSGTPCWSDLAMDLLGADRPCEEFRLVGRDLYARMKTPEQLAADDAAIAFDETHGEFCTHGFPDLAGMLVKKAAKPEKERKRGPLATAIADYIEASGEKTFNRAGLLVQVKRALDKDGRDVRADNLARTLDTQIVGSLLEVVLDTEGTQLQLRGDDNE